MAEDQGKSAGRLASGRARIVLGVGASIGLVVAGGTVAQALVPSEDGTITGCYLSNGNLRVVDAPGDCKKNETTLTWNKTGPEGQAGIQGEQGPQGIQGEVGPQGDQGPQGIQGEVGPQGEQGPQGEVGPQGDQGPHGIQGEVGPQGDQGVSGTTGSTVRSASTNDTSVTVHCPDGKIATGGGGNSDKNLNASYPVMTGNTPTGWTARFQSSDSDNTVYVICAS